ncbi:hypothetical protein A2U01_0075454, partial [Trifolium medium]|nr:hypothetical protein [Trifolium medium]
MAPRLQWTSRNAGGSVLSHLGAGERRPGARRGSGRAVARFCRASAQIVGARRQLV